MYNEKTKAFAKNKEQKLIEALGHSREHNDVNNGTRNRDNYQRDYASILHSHSFQRLQGKIQIFKIDPEKFTRNRLTHSLEVAQIARSIASVLELQYPLVVELGGLAHDLGIPPFGRSGEKMLNIITGGIGGYLGNAQALRILRKLEKKYSYCTGLNLTHRSLLSIIKYPNIKSPADKFIYDEDYAFYQRLLMEKHKVLEAGEKTIDAQIIYLADEIAHAAYDLEEALSRKMVTIEDIEYEFLRSPSYSDALNHFSEIVIRSKETANQAKFMNSSEEFAIIFRKNLSSNIVNCLSLDITVVKSDGGFEELGYGKLKALAEGLKKFVFEAVMQKRNILAYQIKGEMIISDLYHFYNAANNYNFLPSELKYNLSNYKTPQYEVVKARAIIDYISGMMETFSVKEWENHCNK